MLKGIARAYNCAQYKSARSESGKVMICKEGEADSMHYVDPSSGTVYAVEHVARTATQEEVDASHLLRLETERKAIEAKLKAYVASRKGNEAEVDFGVYSTADDALAVVIRGERVNLRNYWSGNWISVWRLALSPDGAASVDGSLKIRAHYFEDGNVQLQTTKAHPATPLSPPLADALVSHIEAAESELQTGLEDMYANMTDETFKAMRRVMPITRTKMKWNINEIALNRNLRK